MSFLSFFHGIEVTSLPDGIALTQRKFTHELLRDAGITAPKMVTTPLPITPKLHHDDGSSAFPDPTYYRNIVGKLNFFTHTRPNLSFAVQILSQFMQHPSKTHFKALTHTLDYIACTAWQGILLRASNQLKLHAFSDLDWATCIDTRCSVIGYLMMLGSSPVS